ncbi:hypothetical protein ACH4E5_03380 [Streptomyces afghaniensis]|uniref:hypothetical protein n=1 Tax=Streptomyces afghaniensis TaxID=66865 RepID=UPI0037A5F8AB
MTELSTTFRAPLPVFRAAVFAFVGAVLGVSAHHLIAEGPAPWRQSAAAVAVLFAVGLAGARRPRSLMSVMAVCDYSPCPPHPRTANATIACAGPYGVADTGTRQRLPLPPTRGHNMKIHNCGWSID